MPEGRLSFCMVTTFYPPYHFGGDAMYAYRLSNALARRGHLVTVVHSADAYRALRGSDPPPVDHPEGVTVRALERSSPRTAALASYLAGRPAFYASELAAMFRHEHFDVIHFHNVSLVGGPDVLRYGSGIKLYTTHEHWLVCPMHVLFRDNREPCVDPHCFRCTLRFRRPPQLWRYTGLLERSVPHVDLFLSPSSFTIEAHRARGFEGAMRRLPLFVPESEIGRAARANGGRPYFLFVGRLEHLKGVQVLVELFRSYRDADLLIAGEGTCGASLRRQAEGLDHVHFLGGVYGARLDALYRDATALLVPSVGYETFGMVIVEAMARGTPSIVHDLGALPEVIEDSGRAGIVYRTADELLDAMRRIRADPGLRTELGERGRDAWRERWSEEPHLEGYFEAVAEARSAV